MIPGLEPPTFWQFFFGTTALFIIAAGMLLSVYAPIYFLEKLFDMITRKPSGKSSDRTSSAHETQYRIYADGSVVHEDDFEEYDHAQPYHDDYRTVSVPDEIVAFIAAEFFPGIDNLSRCSGPDYDFYILSGGRVLTCLEYSTARHKGFSGLSPYSVFSVPREVIDYIAKGALL